MAGKNLTAGLLMYRRRMGRLEVLLAHPGGPFFARKDAGVWSLPKGLLDPGEEPLAAARREFIEETSFAPPDDGFLPLGEVEQTRKRVVGWAFEGDCDPAQLASNEFELEWPPGSGQRRRFPEIDRVQWFDLETAREKMNRAQVAFLDRLRERLDG